MNKVPISFSALSQLIWQWILHLTWRARAGWAFVAPLVFISAFPWFLGSSEELFRWTGAALQLAGFLLAIINLVGLEQLFGEKSLPQKFLNWWLSSPRPMRKNTAHMNAVAGGSTVSVSAVLWRGYTGDIEARLSALQENLGKVVDSVAELRSDSETKIRELRADQMTGAAQLAAKISNLESKVGKALVEGTTAEWVGIWLFVLGTITGSLSPELCSIFGGRCT